MPNEENLLKSLDVPYSVMTSYDPRDSDTMRPWTHLRRNILASQDLQVQGGEVDPVFNWMSSKIDLKEVVDEVEQYNYYAIYTSKTALDRVEEDVSRYLSENENIYLINSHEGFNVKQNVNFQETSNDMIVSPNLLDYSNYTENASDIFSDSVIQFQHNLNEINLDIEPTIYHNVTVIGHEPVHALSWSQKGLDNELLGQNLGIYSKIAKAHITDKAKFTDFQSSRKNNYPLLAESYDLIDFIEEELNQSDPMIMGAQFLEIDFQYLTDNVKSQSFYHTSENGNFFILDDLNTNPGSAPDLISSWLGLDYTQSSEFLLNLVSDLTKSDISTSQLENLKRRQEFFLPELDVNNLLSEDKSDYLDFVKKYLT